MSKDKPEALKEEHLEYLNDLRESGVTNMWGASEYLQRDYSELSSKEANDILLYWMDTFK